MIDQTWSWKSNVLTAYICLRQSFADRTVSSVGREPNDTVFLFPPIDFRAGSLIIDLRRHTSERFGLRSSVNTSLLSSEFKTVCHMPRRLALVKFIENRNFGQKLENFKLPRHTVEYLKLWLSSPQSTEVESDEANPFSIGTTFTSHVSTDSIHTGDATVIS